MPEQISSSLQYDWDIDIAPRLDTLTTVQGGYTTATRGVINLADDTKVFVKIASDELTAGWLQQEITVYQRLNAAGYAHIPQLLALKPALDGMAITYLDGCSFADGWDTDKVQAVRKAQEALKQHRHLFEGDAAFQYANNDHRAKWDVLRGPGVVDRLNQKLTDFALTTVIDARDIERFAVAQSDWDMRTDTLIHEDIRADNFGYDPRTKTGKLVDWNWLCISDASLDTTPLFVNMVQSGFDPYELYPEAYDSQMLTYLTGFWLDAILQADVQPGDRDWALRRAQARNAVTCYQLLAAGPPANK